MRRHSFNYISYSASKKLGAVTYSLLAYSASKNIILKNEKETERRDGRRSGRRSWRKIMIRREKNRKRLKVERIKYKKRKYREMVHV